MKSYIYLILLLVYGIFAVQCSDSDDDTPDDTSSENGSDNSSDDGNYTSFWYYSYEAVETITYEEMKLGKSEEFCPYAVAAYGDTLLVANCGTAGNSLILFSKKDSRPFRTIKTWKVNGQEKTFTSKINAIVVADDRLYVAEQQSLIHVFSLPDFEYLSCIGNGSWKGPVFQAQAIAVTKGLLFARDKDGKISVYKESDVTSENYQKINRYKQAGPGAGNSSNNGFAANYMEVDEEGHIMLTGYEAQAFRILDPSLINDDFKNGTNIDIAEKTWALPFKPKTFAITADRIYTTGSNDVINIYDCEQKEWVKTLKSIKGFAFSIPERIYRESDECLWVSDTKNRALVKMGVFKGEIREYESVSEGIVRVYDMQTRNSETASVFYVNIKTHEIVDPSEWE